MVPQISALNDLTKNNETDIFSLNLSRINETIRIHGMDIVPYGRTIYFVINLSNCGLELKVHPVFIVGGAIGLVNERKKLSH